MDTLPHYTGSLPYELLLTSRVLHETIDKFFENCKFPINHDEFAILDTIYCNPGIIQIDLAKLILKGRAHTGRFLMNLEQKGLVKRIPTQKGQRLTYKNIITDEGQILYKDICNKIMKKIEDINENFPQKIETEIIENLRFLRKRCVERYNIKFQ